MVKIQGDRLQGHLPCGGRSESGVRQSLRFLKVIRSPLQQFCLTGYILCLDIGREWTVVTVRIQISGCGIYFHSLLALGPLANYILSLHPSFLIFKVNHLEWLSLPSIPSI